MGGVILLDGAIFGLQDWIGMERTRTPDTRESRNFLWKNSTYSERCQTKRKGSFVRAYMKRKDKTPTHWRSNRYSKLVVFLAFRFFHKLMYVNFFNEEEEE